MTKSLFLVVLVGCVETAEPQPDAMQQSITPDACTRDPSGDCCALLPDIDAASACATEQTKGAPGCGVYLCWQSDCSLVRVNFCS